MSDLVLEILKDIQKRVTSLDERMTRVDSATGVLPRLEAEVSTLIRATAGLQQDVRMIRAAVNDMAHTRVSTGEVEALHTELDQLRANVQEHETRLYMLEHPGGAFDGTWADAPSAKA
jgi:hypothetical protein